MKKTILTLLMLLISLSPSVIEAQETTRLGLELYVNSKGYVAIEKVRAGSMSQEAGFMAGDLILSIDGSPVKEPSIVTMTIESAIYDGKSLLVEIKRNNRDRTLWVKKDLDPVHSRKAIAKYDSFRSLWEETTNIWQTFTERLEQRRLGSMDKESFSRISLEEASKLETLRTRLIENKKTFRFNNTFQQEMIRASNLACRAIFSMDNLIQICSSYDSEDLASHYGRLEKKKHNISNLLSSIETHLFKAKISID